MILDHYDSIVITKSYSSTDKDLVERTYIRKKFDTFFVTKTDLELLMTNAINEDCNTLSIVAYPSGVETIFRILLKK